MAFVFEMNGQTCSIVVALVRLNDNTSGELLMHPANRAEQRSAIQSPRDRSLESEQAVRDRNPCGAPCS